MHQQRLLRCGPPLAHHLASPPRMELLEVDAERHRHHVARADAIELRPGETGRADHDVVVGGGPPVRDVGDRPGESPWQQLSCQAVEALVGDHDRRHAVCPAPLPQRAQRQPVRHLDGVGFQALEQRGDGARPHCAIAAGEGNQSGGQRHSPHARRQLANVFVRAGNHQEHLVAGGAVLRPQAVDGGAQPARTGAVEVGNLDDPHVHPSNRGRVCRRERRVDDEANGRRTRLHVAVSRRVGSASPRRAAMRRQRRSGRNAVPCR